MDVGLGSAVVPVVFSAVRPLELKSEPTSFLNAESVRPVALLTVFLTSSNVSDTVLCTSLETSDSLSAVDSTVSITTSDFSAMLDVMSLIFSGTP
jgi:hypothetical protein